MNTTLDQYHEVRSMKESTCEVYEFRFNPFGWANFYIHEFPNGGVLSIVSDWGNYSHMWGCTGQPSLKHFLAKCDPDYIVNKLSYEKERDFSQIFNSDKTRGNFKKMIIEDRREHRIDHEEARELWDDLEDWSPDHVEEWYWTMPSSLSKQYPDPFEWGFVYEKSPSYRFLVDHLIPFFQRFLREKLESEACPSEQAA